MTQRHPDRPLVVIASPALADANNGNWQTAWRWSRLLAGRYRTQIVKEWRVADHPGAVALLALHARRTAASIAAWAQAHPGRGLGVVLTGTDLYRDIATDAAAQHSLAVAQRLVVLQDQGPLQLESPQLVPDLRERTRVIFQSTTARQPLAKTTRHLRVVMVGHLREEKSPETLFAAAQLLRDAPGIQIDHIGAALDPALGDQARATMAACPHYRWLGALPHEATRRRIQRAHLLVHCSRMEGGAHVLMEAVCSGTPVLASRIPGNVGMLGTDYPGYFAWGDAQALAQLLRTCQTDLTSPHASAAGMLAHLQAKCSLRAPLFAPAAERAGLLALLDELLNTP